MQLETDPLNQADVRALTELSPWMNPFRLSDGWILGYYKPHGLDRTFVAPDDPDIETYHAAFREYMAGDPFWQVDQLLDRLGHAPTILELGCGTGRLAFHLALRGARVVGVDISERNIRAAQFLRRLDRRLAAASVSFEHVPVSADDPAFLAGRSFDAVVVSVFPFLARLPIQLANVARLARRAALFHVIVRPPGKDGWELLHGGPEWRASYPAGMAEILCGVADDDWGWRPSVPALAAALRQCGFSVVTEITHPQLRDFRSVEACLQPSRARRLLLPGGVHSALARVRSRGLRRKAVALSRRFLSPAYHTFLAEK